MASMSTETLECWVFLLYLITPAIGLSNSGRIKYDDYFLFPIFIGNVSEIELSPHNVFDQTES